MVKELRHCGERCLCSFNSLSAVAGRRERELRRELPVKISHPSFVALSLLIAVHNSWLVAADNNQHSGGTAYKITLSSDSNTVPSGKTVQVKVTVTSVSGKDITLVRNAVRDRGGIDYKFDVRNVSTASTVSETPLNRA